jgi:hypothetical protein
MAIDNREKRQSTVGINRVGGPSVTPTLGKDQEWRQEVGYGYSGILADDPAPASFVPSYALNLNTLIGGGFSHV